MTNLYLRTNDYRFGTIAENGVLEWPSVDIFHNAYDRNSATVRYVYVEDERRFVVLPPVSDSVELELVVTDNIPVEETVEAISAVPDSSWSETPAIEITPDVAIDEGSLEPEVEPTLALPPVEKPKVTRKRKRKTS